MGSNMAARTFADTTVNSIKSLTNVQLPTYMDLPRPYVPGSLVYSNTTHSPYYSTGANWIEFGGGTAYAMFTYAPNLETNFAIQDPNVFSVWADLVAAVADLPSSTIKLILFTLRGTGSATTAIIPDGTYDLTNCIFFQNPGDGVYVTTAGTPPLEIDLGVDDTSAGVFFNGLLGVDGNYQINVNQLIATGAVMVTSGGDGTNIAANSFFLTNGAVINGTSAGCSPFLDVVEYPAPGYPFVMGRDSALINTDGPVIQLNTTADCNLALIIKEPIQTIEGDTIIGTGSVSTMNMYFYAKGGWSAAISLDAATYTGVDTLNVIDRSGNSAGTNNCTPHIHLHTAAPDDGGTDNASQGYFTGDIWVQTNATPAPYSLTGGGTLSVTTSTWVCTNAASGTWLPTMAVTWAA